MKTAKLASQQRHGQEYSLAASRRVINFQGTLSVAMMRSLARSSASSFCKAALNSSILWRSILPSMAVSQALPDDGVNILTGSSQSHATASRSR
jgi:hypothetical protein